MEKPLSSDWIKHFPDHYECNGINWRDAGLVIETGDCECGIHEHHVHCKGCGHLISKGSGEVIWEY